MDKKVLHAVIDHVSIEFSQRVAIEQSGRSCSYEALKEYSNQIGNCLIRQDIAVGTVVGVYLESSVEYVASLLGINKSGGIFMPLELAYPVKRLEYLLDF